VYTAEYSAVGLMRLQTFVKSDRLAPCFGLFARSVQKTQEKIPREKWRGRKNGADEVGGNRLTSDV